MSLILWDNTFSVHIKEIDEQHKKLVNLINSLYDAMKAGKGKEVLHHILDELIDYTKNHFSKEEKMMGQYGYPTAALHKMEHDKFTKKVLTMQNDLEKGNAVLSMDVLQFLKDWLLQHIQKTDKQYSPFLNSKGVV
ncbi:MAG TPA: bacteriohemerythrin [Bacteroidota bacterium]|nr:bacteriohemerythrin [Bacteroidota bacterium]